MYGHSHNYERGAVQDGNLRLMLSGGGGSALDRWGMYNNQTNYPEIQRSFDHYCYALFDIDIENKKYEATTYSLGHPDLVLDNVIIDAFSRDKRALPLDRPELISPVTESVIKPPFSLEAEDYTKNFDIMSSQFQVSADQGNYSDPIRNSIRDFEDVYGDTGPPDYSPIDLNNNIDLSKLILTGMGLEEGKSYWWRMRFRDKNLQWTDWSEERKFTVSASTQISEEDDLIVKKTELYNNYPNPFNATTLIRFSLKEAGHVNLDIYSIEGKIVRTLINKEMPAGKFSVTWDV